MVGLSAIPSVGKIVDRISDATVDALFRGFSYMFYYKDHVNVLNSNIEKLNTEKDRMSKKVEEETDNGKIIIIDDVRTWQTNVEDFQKSAEEFEEKYKNRSSWRCIQCLPIPNPVSRFQLGRKAVHMAKQVSELIDSGKDYLVPEIFAKSDTVFQYFQSREDAYKKLWEALVTEDSSMILGIYGMPGVGKTRMMEQIWKEAKEKKIFDKVTRANVGNEKLDVIKLQNQIAGHLDCHLDSQDNEESRASQLKNSLLNGGKILVILDDVWREIPLHRIGISFGDGSSSRGCKILITSGQKNVCLVNRCMHPVKITPLTEDEAWDLFRNTVGGDNIDHLQDESLAQKVCEKCAGLPLAIRAIGKALKSKSHNSWKDALYQLEKGKFEKIAGIDQDVYACIKLSVDNLEEDAKSCLFLCSLYPEDADIPMRKLIQLATGSLVPDGEARVCAMVESLKLSSLLLDSHRVNTIKLHDLIRDVARYIANRDPKYAFLLIRCDSRLPDYADYCSRKLLRLDLEKNDFRFPDSMVCPDLHNLWLQCNMHIQQFSGGFFGMFVNLKFLLIEGMISFMELQFSLQPLGKLRTLILDHCDLTHIDQTKVSLFPQNLETLCIWDCDLPVPLDLSNLKNLQKLEIEGGETGVQLVEISKLTGLKSLGMFFRDSEPLQETNIFGSLLQFNICVGKPGSDAYYDPDWSVSIKKSISIELHGNNLQVLESLIERAEEVRLNCNDINVSNIYNRNREAFTELRYLYIEGCNTTEYLARISEDEIQHSLFQPSFSKLTILEIKDCSAMKYLFSKSVAKCLVQLQQLTVVKCPLMEAIVLNEEGTSDGDIINFSKLDSLKLVGLPRLTSFCWHNSVQFQPLFDEMVSFPSLENLHIEDLEDTSVVWDKHFYYDNVSSSFCKLKNLLVANCKVCIRMDIVIPLAMLQRLQNLEYLKVYSCNSLISAVGTHGSNTAVYPLVALCAMDLESLPCLTKTGLNSRDHSFSKLTILEIKDWSAMKYLFCNSVAKCLGQLQKLHIENCPMIEAIIMNEDTSDRDIIDFSLLKSLELVGLPRLASFYGKAEFLNSVDVEPSSGEINWEETVENVRNDEASGMDKKTIMLFELRSIILKDTPNLKSFFHNANYECQMRALVEVEVQNCELSTLFTTHVFKNLQQLRELRVSNCTLLEGIVEDATDDKTVNQNDKTIKLYRLSTIVLKNLPNLKSFSRTASYAFEMPALYTLKLFECPLVENFSSKKTSTGLVSVYTEGQHGEGVSDLNDYIRQNRKRGSNLSDTAGESSSSNPKQDKEAERVGSLSLSELQG